MSNFSYFRQYRSIEINGNSCFQFKTESGIEIIIPSSPIILMYPYRPCRHEFVRTFDWNNKASNQLYYRSLLPTIDVATDMIRLPRLEHVPIYTELTFEGASDTYQHSRMYVRRIAARAVKCSILTNNPNENLFLVKTLFSIWLDF